MALTFEDLHDDTIYIIRTFLDFPSEMALDSTSRTIRSVMRDVVHPRMKVLDVDREMNAVEGQYPGIDLKQTFQKYVEKARLTIQTFIMRGESHYVEIPDAPKLKNIHVSLPVMVMEVEDIQMFSMYTLAFCQTIRNYYELPSIEELCVYAPTSFEINSSLYPCTAVMADKICCHLVEEDTVFPMVGAQNRMKKVHLPKWLLESPSKLRETFPKAKVSFWDKMSDEDTVKQAKYGRLMAAL